MILLTFLILLFCYSAPAKAQSTGPAPSDLDLFNQYRQDYLYQQDLYQKSYLDYIDKRQIHTKYNTITTQSDKDRATKDVMINRNNMLKSYLMALRVRTNIYTSPDTFYDTQKIKIEIYKWEDWLAEQNLIVESLNNDGDIQKWASVFDARYDDIKRTIYGALIQKEINLRYSSLQMVKSLTDKVRIYKNVPKDNQSWLTTIAIKSDLVISSLHKAKSIVSDPDTAPDKAYLNSKNEIMVANNYFADILSALKAIIIQNS